MPDLTVFGSRIYGLCRQCGEPFDKPRSVAKHGNPMYCSPECHYQWRRENGWSKSKDKVELICEICGERYEKHSSAAERSRFCSKRCVGVANGRRQAKALSVPRVKCVCKWCGGHFKKLRSQMTENRGSFCSRACLGSYTIQHHSRVSVGEIELGRLLAEAGLRIEPSARIGKWIVDFRVGGIVVEYDGDYWHSLPDMIHRDKRKDRDLRKRGYDVVRIKEGNFARDPEAAVAAVLEATERRASLWTA